MEFDRRVQIWVGKKDGKAGFGSGYLVAPRLVLTAAHVLDGMAPAPRSPVTVSLPDTGEGEFPASVRWQRRDDIVDAALIEIAEGHGWQVPQSLGGLLTRPPQRYGLIIGTRPHPVTASGFPHMQKDSTDGRRWDEQFTGRIAPGTGSLAGRYELTSTDPIPAASNITGGGSRWAGMSGAAVLTDDGFGGDLLCGVMRRDRQADGGARLTATPAARLLADDAFRRLIFEHTGWEPVLEPVEPAALLTPAAIDRNLPSPAALLRADAEAVTFHGRASELADWQAWCENGPPAIQLRVLTGPGGQGKTRLARRLTETLGWRGWVTGHLSSDLTDTPTLDAAPPDFTTLTTSLPLLLVVDYAETRPRLLRRLITYLNRSRHRVRVLLLARSDGPWRTGSHEAIAAVENLLEEAPVIPLAPLIPTSQPAKDRRDAFGRAAHDLALLLPLLPTLATHDWTSLAATLRPPADLQEYRYDNVLTLQMTALISLLQHGPRPVDAVPGTPPERTLLKHEERFWEASAKGSAYKLNLPTPTLGAAVAVAALCGASKKEENEDEEAVRVLATLPGLPAGQTALAAAWLASLYPPDGNRYWGSLQPDRIAEYHASRTLAEGDIELPALLGAAAPGQQAQLLIVLARAAIAHYNAGRLTDSEFVLRTTDTALDAAPLVYQAVQVVTDALPYLSRVTSPLAVRLSIARAHADQQLVADDPVTFEPYLAHSLANLGIRLLEAGRRGEAVTAGQQAVEIRQRLAADDPVAFEPDLARSLTNLGNQMSEVGRRGEALTVGEEAVEIYRRLAVDDSAAFEYDLADSLSNLGIRLSEVGRWGEALTVAGEAVEIFRRLAVNDPVAFESDLARSLSNLGMHLSEVGRRGEALTATEEAVGICRRLAVRNPAAFEPYLASLLSNLGNRLAEAGRRGEALAAERQAVEIRQRLATDDPAAFEPGLANSLSNLGIRLSEVGRWGEALTVAGEAVEIYRRLAVNEPAAFEPDLARSLTNLGAWLSEAGRQGEALTATEEAVGIYHQLAASNPAAFEPYLASLLSNLGVLLAQAGQWSEALTAERRAVEIRQRLATDNPAAFEPGLANSLSNLSIRLSQAGQQSEASTAIGEAVEIYRRLAMNEPAAFEPYLANSLYNRSKRLPEVGRWGEALTTAEEAVEIYRQLAADDPAAFEPDLADSMAVFAALLEVEGDLPGALRATREAVQLYRAYAATMPYALRELHTVLDFQAELLERLGHEEEMKAVRRWLRENPLFQS